MKKVLAMVVALLATPASASAYSSVPATATQRGSIEWAAKRTHPCGYSGQFKQLANFRVASFGSAHFTVNIASVLWSPPQADQCQIVFVNEPGHTLKSLVTPSHPYLSWAALTWGSSPFDEPSALSRYWREWFPNRLPPNWRTVAQELVRGGLPELIAGRYAGRQPANIDISGDAGNIVTDLRWSSWGQARAVAVGTSNIQNCVPNCAEGTDTPVRTSIVLSEPKHGCFSKMVEQRDGQTETYFYTPGHTPDLWPDDAS